MNVRLDYRITALLVIFKRDFAGNQRSEALENGGDRKTSGKFVTSSVVCLYHQDYFVLSLIKLTPGEIFVHDPTNFW